MTIRVLIVDDHPVTRDGLRSALSASDEIELVGEATDGEEALEQVKKLQPDIVFMDVRMPGMSGLEATRAIREFRPETKVILFTVDETQAAVTEAIQAGISGYLLKDSGAPDLIRAARLALEGKTVIHPTITEQLIDQVRLPVPKHPEAPLSPRETEILQKVAWGATTKEVAHQLGISAHTVKTHLERIYDKLGANDRAQAVAIAIRLGLVD